MKTIFTLLASLLAMNTWAQNEYCKDENDIVASEAKTHANLLQVRTNPYTDNYDLKYHRFEWEVDPRVYYIKGTVTTYFMPTKANFNEINFNLSKNLKVKLVRYHNQNVNFTQTTDERVQISLPGIIGIGKLDSISLTYEGTPPRTGFGSFSQTFHNNTPIIWTLSEPYGSSDWWPSKVDLGDKVDSIDVLVKTPQQYRVASNGLLVSELQQDTFKTHHWKHRYPITPYLVAIGVTNYVYYTDYVRLPGGDSLPILNYVYPEELDYAKSQTYRAVQCMELYNRLFGIYPFSKEKYGHAHFGFGGGEEHQTMTFLSDWSHLLQSHELGHQWFGDKVTCGSWRDIWLNEGFATYTEGLTHEAGIGTTTFRNWLQETINYVTSQPGGSVWVTDTTSVSRIFNGRLTYDKGGMLVHMLRWKLTDSTFFRGVRNYLNDPQLAYGYAKTEDLQRNLEAVSGQNLTKFFKDWFYGQGYPSYRIEWQQTDNQVNVQIFQTTSHSSVSFFEMPVQIQFLGANNQSVLARFDHTANGQSFSANVNFPITGVVFDPNLWLLSKNNQIVNGLTGTQELQMLASQVQIFPNPAQSELKVDISKLAANVLQAGIFDAKGSLVKRLFVLNNFESITISDIPSGIYILKLQTDQGAIGKNFVKH